MRPTIYTIDFAGPGRLSTMAMPRGNDWLSEEMSALQHLGVDVLVSALMLDESHELGLEREQEHASATKLEYISLPIKDRDVPDVNLVAPTLGVLKDRVNDGKHVAVHCRYGIGRSSLIVAAVLVSNGVPPVVAWDSIADVRGLPVPDTLTQREWIKQFVGRRPGN